MSLKNIGKLGESAKILEGVSSLKALIQNRSQTTAQTDSFATIRDSLEGLKVDEASKKLKDLKLNPDLAVEILEAANNNKILKGTTEEIEEGIKKVGQSSSFIDDLGLAFEGLGQSIKTGLSSLWSFAVANPVIAGIAAIGVAIIGTMLISDKFIETYDEASEKAKESADAYNTTKSELESLDSELKTTESRLKELQKLQDGGTITVAEEEELKRLQVTNEELQREYNIKKKLAELQKEQASKDAENALNKLDASVASTYDDKGNKYHEGSKIYDANVQGMTDADALEASMEKVKEYREEIVKLQEKQANAKNQKEFDKIQKDIDKYQSAIDDMESDMGTRAQNISDNLQNISDKDSELYKTNSKIVEDYLNMDSSSTAEELERINDALKDTKLSFTDTLSNIQSLSKGLDQLDKIYADVKDGEYFDFSSILNNKEFTEAFGGLGESYENFIKTITNSPSDINACQQAFNDLATAYIYNSKELENVTDETKASTIEMLKQMGVANAEEVVTAALTKAKAKQSAEEAFLAEKKDNSAISSSNLTDATWQEVYAVWAESTASETAKQYLSQLALTKLDVQNIKLDTKSDIDNIIALAKAAGTSTEYLGALQKALYALQGAQSKKSYLTSSANSLNVVAAAKGGKLLQEVEKVQTQEDIIKQSKAEIESIMSSIKNVNLKASDFYAPVTYGGGSTSNKNSGSTKETKETFDWIEIALSRLQRTITNLGKTVSATWKSWTDRNSALKSQISAVTQEINLQQQAANKYWTLASNVGLGEGYKSLVRNGAMDISTITDENTIDAIKQYQEYYENYLDALDAKQEAEDELASLVREDFDMIAKQFDSEISLVEANISTLEAHIDQAEMKGNLVSKNYYSAMYAEEQKNLSLLQQKYDQLSDKLSNGTIAQGSEEFNNMATEIKEVNKAIIESNTALEEYQKTMRELDWEVFDLIEEKIGNVAEESEFLIDLLSNSKLFNDDGSITSQGQATLGLHVANMKIYESQVKDYADEIARLDEEFANDSLDQDYLERRQELIELQRDAILNCQDEKDSIKDLMSQGYDNLLSYMDELISKRKELLSQASDARSFQKTVQEQTDDISRLQNILNSYNGDLSEEAKVSIQKYEIELKDAQSNLEDTLYDKYISDQEQMLDALADDTEQWVNERLDNIDGLIEDVVDATDKNAETIKTTLETEVQNVGGTLTTEMQNLWSGADGVKSVVGGVNNTLLDIKALVQSMVKGSDAEASKNVSNATSNVTPNTSKPATTPSTQNTNNSSAFAKTITVGGMINAGSALIYDYAGDTSGERQYYRNSPYYRVLDERNNYLKVRHQSLSSGTTGWFKKSDVKAYKTGGKVDYTGLAMVHGSRSKPELMLNAKDTENFIQLKDALSVVAKTNMFDAIGNYAKLPNFMPNATNNNQQAMIIQGDIVLPNVHNREDLARELKEIYQHDVSHVRKTIRADVYGGMLGKNSLTRFKY